MLDSKYTTFLTLYKTKSYTETAKQLFVTQPAVSQKVRALQQELNLKLVDYNKSKLTFTQEGTELARLIERTETQTQQVLAQISDSQQVKSISFGTTLSFNEMIEPEFIKSLTRTYPRINCTVKNTTTIIEQLASGEIEFGLIEGNFERQNFASIPISTDKFIGVCSADSPLSQAKVSIKDILNSQLLIREPGSGSRFIFENWLASMNYDLDDFAKVISIGDIVTIQQLLSENVGISFMYESAVNSLPQYFHLSTFELADFDINHELSLVYIPGTPKEKTFAKIAEQISDILK